ncbi:MAG: hypothetical protein M1831_000837 [Alyxoria varia]|nr:MAG: hypothetical protein M1831_000837 [Alyxoria varia]
MYSAALDAAASQGHTEIIVVLFEWYKPHEYGLSEDESLKNALFHSRLDVVQLFLTRFPKLKATCHSRIIPQSLGDGPSLLHDTAERSYRPPINGKQETASCSPVRSYGVPKDLSNFDAKYSDILGVSHRELTGHCDRGDLMRLAAKLGDVDIIQQLLSRGISSEGSEDFDTCCRKARPIEIAAAYGHVGVVQVLFRHQRVLSRSLIFATRFSRVEVIEVILQESRDIEVDVENFGAEYERPAYSSRRKLCNKSALAMAIEIDNLEIFRTLLNYKVASSHPRPNFALLKAARDHRTTYLHEMLNREGLWQISEEEQEQTQSIPTFLNRQSSSYNISGQGENVWSSSGAQEDDFMNRESEKDEPLDTEEEEDDERNDGRNERLFAERKDQIAELEKITERYYSRPSTLVELAAKEAGVRGSLQALQLLLSSGLCSPSPGEMLFSVVREASRSAPAEVLHIIESSCGDPIEAQELLKSALSKAFEAEKKFITRKRDLDMSSVWDLFVRYFGSADMRCPAELTYTANLLEESIMSDRLDVAHSILTIVDSAFKILRRKTSIVSHLIEHSFINDHDSHPQTRQLVELLLAHGANDNATDESFFLEPMSLACASGISSAFFALVDAGANFLERVESPQEIRTQTNRSIILRNVQQESTNLVDLALRGLCLGDLGRQWHYSLSKRYGDIIYFLVHDGMIPDIDHDNFANVCQIACFQGDDTYLQILLRVIARVVGEGNSQKFIDKLDLLGLLHGAAYGGQVSMVEYLLGIGLNPRCATHFEASGTYRSPMSAPVATTYFYGDSDGSRHSFRLRTSGRSKNEDAQLIERKLKILTRFLDFGVDERDLIDIFEYAASHGETQIVSRLLHEGLPSAKEEDITECLENVIAQGQKKVVETIMCQPQELHRHTVNILATICTKRADVKMYKTARLDSCYINRRYVYEERDKVRFGHYNEPTNMLSRVLLSGDCGLNEAQSVLDLGADPTLPGLPMTAIGYLARSCNSYRDYSPIPVLHILVNSGCDVNQAKPASVGNTTVYDHPLHIAIRAYADRSFLETLINHGADIHANGGFGTPLFQARELQHESAVQLLIEKGASIMAGENGFEELTFLKQWHPPQALSHYHWYHFRLRDKSLPAVDRSGKGFDLDRLPCDWNEYLWKAEAEQMRNHLDRFERRRSSSSSPDHGQ